MTEAQPTKNEYTIEPLSPVTWDAFADLAERHNGVWCGCWCTWFYTMHAEQAFERRRPPALEGAPGQSGPGPCRTGFRR